MDWQEKLLIRRMSFTHLGIHIALLPSLTWRFNLAPLIERMKNDLNKWSISPSMS